MYNKPSEQEKLSDRELQLLMLQQEKEQQEKEQKQLEFLRQKQQALQRS